MGLLHSSLIVIKLEPSSSFAFILKPSKTYIRKVLGTYDHMPGKHDSGWLSHLLPLQGPPTPPAICDTCIGNVKDRPVSFLLLPSQWPEYKLGEVSALSVIKRDHCWKSWVSCKGNLPFNYCTLNCVLCIVMCSWDWPAVKDCKACCKLSHASLEILGFLRDARHTQLVQTVLYDCQLILWRK